MATNYSHKKVEADFHILRNDEHIATYDPVGEGVTYIGDGKKYAGPIAKEVSAITAQQIDGTDYQARCLELEGINCLLERTIENLKVEIAQLQDGSLDENNEASAIPDRYVDKVDESEAPVKDPALGDLTPEYIEWARRGGMEPTVFVRRYEGRIKDLSIPKPE